MSAKFGHWRYSRCKDFGVWKDMERGFLSQLQMYVPSILSHPLSHSSIQSSIPCRPPQHSILLASIGTQKPEVYANLGSPNKIAHTELKPLNSVAVDSSQVPNNRPVSKWNYHLLQHLLWNDLPCTCLSHYTGCSRRESRGHFFL